MYTKTRQDFGRHARFDDEPSEARFVRTLQPTWSSRVGKQIFTKGQKFAVCADLFPSLVSSPRQVVSDIRPEPELKADYIERNPVTTTVQVAPELSEHEVRWQAILHSFGFFYLCAVLPVLG